jgi:2,4-dienoyl-CoA reductase-like NADH-dependent reductase (Old Yellow Enzyme family)
MAAMTRGFCGPNHTATSLMAEYYGKRADNGVGLILTEGTIIHTTGDGYNNVPHIETDQQAKSWGPVVSRVHESGGKIICQLWHCGRISHSDYTGGVPPLSSSDVAAEGINRQNGRPFGRPKAMAQEDFAVVTDQFVRAARNAIEADFDGVQLHFGHGYLVDQFFDNRINRRADCYGGSVGNRCRFAVEILEQVIAAIGAPKVMVRISPSREMGGAIYEWQDLEEMLKYLLSAFDRLGLRMLDISCANSDYYSTAGRLVRVARQVWPYFLIGGASLSVEQAEDEVRSGFLDMVTWGRALIANPDLPIRFKNREPLIQFDRDMLGYLS